MQYINEVSSRNELADFINIKRSTLSYVLYIQKKEEQYRSFEIPKRNGGVRSIYAPQGALKEIQVRLFQALTSYKKNLLSDNKGIDIYSHGYEKNKSIITNAKRHRNKRYVFNVDLKDFFPSIHFGRVRGFFLKNQYFQLTEEVATVLAQLTCYNDTLPQGAPTSPIISNLICEVLDYRISKISKKYRLSYTRYADDLTFSTNRHDFMAVVDDFMKELEDCIERAGFHINKDKTRISFNASRQEVTGVVVNKRISVKREYYKKTRAMADCLYKNGLFEIDGVISSINRLEGRFAFINELDMNDNLLNIGNRKSGFNAREHDYQRFLFYKFFYANPYPLIIVEGKTDVMYIKSALKSLYKRFPDLVLKDEDGRFKYKVRFLKRTNRLKYFFKFEKDGADTILNIYKQYTINTYNNGLGCAEYFRKKYEILPKNPVIMLLDNELSNKEKPIYKLVNTVNNRDNVKKELRRKCYSHLEDNLYVAVCPMGNDQKECEIEDLFCKETLSTIIDGKTFDRHRKKGDMEHYDKVQFANYIMKNYMDVDFNGFVPLLDTVSSIIASYEQIY